LPESAENVWDWLRAMHLRRGALALTLRRHRPDFGCLLRNINGRKAIHGASPPGGAPATEWRSTVRTSCWHRSRRFPDDLECGGSVWSEPRFHGRKGMFSYAPANQQADSQVRLGLTQ